MGWGQRQRVTEPVTKLPHHLVSPTFLTSFYSPSFSFSLLPGRQLSARWPAASDWTKPRGEPALRPSFVEWEEERRPLGTRGLPETDAAAHVEHVVNGKKTPQLFALQVVLAGGQ